LIQVVAGRQLQHASLIGRQRGQFVDDAAFAAAIDCFAVFAASDAEFWIIALPAIPRAHLRL
jgi:hypothetical protein